METPQILHEQPCLCGSPASETGSEIVTTIVLELPSGQKFRPGKVCMTQGVKAALSPTEVCQALTRHVFGDWGDLDPEDRAANERALLAGDRLLSVYHSKSGIKFYIITEWDRSLTTGILSEEY